MSTEAKLKAEPRVGRGKGVARKLRAAGKVPAVVYGAEGETRHVSLDAHDADYLFRRISVDNTIVDLEVDGAPVQTLVREIQTHPWKGTILHVDFLRIQAGVAVEMDVPVDLVGTPLGVRENGGTLEQIIHDLPIRCIPSKIPEVISVDVSGLDVNDVIHVSDLSFDEGVEVMIPLDRTICSVAPPRTEVEESVEAAEEPELVGEGERDGEPRAKSDGGSGDSDRDED